MGKFGFILFLFSFFLFPDLLTGQKNYAVKTYTTDQGLPHNHVYSMAQDRNGFLWLATFDGLSRWDGYEFRNYYHNPGDTTSISYFEVQDVMVDSFNNVWSGCSFSLAKYNPSTENFTRFNNFKLINHPRLSTSGKLWVSAKEGIFFWDQQKQHFEKFAFKAMAELQRERNGYPPNIIPDNRERLWIWSHLPSGEVIISIVPTDVLEPVEQFLGKANHNQIYQSLETNPRESILPFVSADGNHWLFTNIGTFKLNKKNSEFELFPDFNPVVHLAGNDPWWTTKVKEFLRSMSPSIGKTHEITTFRDVVSENYLIDRQQTVWQSMLAHGGGAIGLTRCVPVSCYFKHYFTGYNPPGRINAFFPVIKDRFGTVWGGATNLNRYFIQEKSGKNKQVEPIDRQTWQLGQRPRAFLEDSAGVWIGYLQNLLLRYDFDKQSFHKILLKKTHFSDRSMPTSFVHLKKDGENLLIIGFKDIFHLNPTTGKLKAIKQFSYNENVNLYSVLHDADGWWVGASASSILHFDHDFRTMEVFTLGSGMFNVEDVVEGDNNDLWLSQLGGGLLNFNKKTHQSVVYTTADGLSNNTCYGMLKDKRGNLWISTNQGITRFNPKTRQFRIFGPEDGLKIVEFNSDNTYQAPDGEMFFAGMGGIVSFYPDSIADDQKEPPSPLVIEDFKVSGANRYFKKAIYECDTVVLNKGDNNFEASFACLDFRNSDKIKYRYRLSGENDAYVETDHRHRSVNYSSLGPGEYLFDLEAANRDGDWVSKRSLLIIIPPFYYQTAWFRSLVIFLVVLLISNLVYGYNRRIRLKARQQQEELRLESLRGQMNPHFIFNSLNSINYFISQNDRLSANRYIADFSRLIRSILGNMSNDYIPLALELESLHDYLKLEHLRFNDKFDYTIQVYEGILPEELMVFPGMVQPFVENAIWHGVRGLEGRKGLVTVEFRLVNSDYLVCVIEDDGVGRKHSEKFKSQLPGKTSRGIGIVQERLKIINNLRKTNFQVKIDDIYTDREETGTRVIIDIPKK
jgi:streptogramin lyase